MSASIPYMFMVSTIFWTCFRPEKVFDHPMAYLAHGPSGPWPIWPTAYLAHGLSGPWGGWKTYGAGDLPPPICILGALGERKGEGVRDGKIDEGSKLSPTP